MQLIITHFINTYYYNYVSMQIDPNNSIGVFDSGVGGLTVVRSLIEQLPFENIIYFGDTARVPYGVKSVETCLTKRLNCLLLHVTLCQLSPIKT